MAITNILNYTPPPDEETVKKRKILLIVAVAVSLLMTLTGYAIILMLFLRE